MHQPQDHTQRTLAYAFCAGYFVLFLIVIWYGINETVETVAITLFAILTGAVKDIISYYFGGSHGSEKQTDALADVAKQPSKE